MIENKTETDFELRRTIVNEFGDFDLFLMDKTNSYHKEKPSGAESIHEWPEVTIYLPDVVSKKYAKYLVERFDSEFGIVYNSLSEFGLGKVREEIDCTGFGKNIPIYDMLIRNDTQPRFIDSTPFTKPSGIIYESTKVRIHPSIKKKLIDMSDDIGVDRPTLLLMAISIALKDSTVINNHFRSASRGTALLMSSKLFFALKIKNASMLDFFEETSLSHLKMYTEMVESSGIGDGMMIEGYRWALNQLKSRQKLCGDIPNNPLKKEVIAYKKELKRIIIEYIGMSGGSINNKKSKEINKKRNMIKHIIKDNPFIGDEIKGLFETLNENVEYMNRTYWRT